MASKYVMFFFLDDLRHASVGNMFGARRTLMDKFDIPPARAMEVLKEWVKTYKQRHSQETNT